MLKCANIGKNEKIQNLTIPNTSFVVHNCSELDMVQSQKGVLRVKPAVDK